MELTHIDCFSGPGGICTGFNAAGIKTVLALEKVASCVETYSANHPDVAIWHGDIRNATEVELKKRCDLKEVDIVTSGMPCETFSTAGSKSRSSYDHRQELYQEAIKVAKFYNAKIILFENVSGFMSKRISKEKNSKYVYELLQEDLHKAGYDYQKTYILNSKDFGVPQSRERFFHIASRLNIEIFDPKPTLLQQSTSVEEAFQGLAKVNANEGENGVLNLTEWNHYIKLMRDEKFWKIHPKPMDGIVTYHIAPNHRQTTIKRFTMINQGEGLKDLFDKLTPQKLKRLQEEKVLPKKWFIQRNRRLQPDSVSPTVTSHCLDELLHPTLHRSVTIREAARLQSFPDAYDFVGGPMICPHMYETQDKYEQIGDAVPPILSYEWAIAIKRTLGVGNDL